MQDINLIQIILVTLVAFVAGMASVLDDDLDDELD